MAQGISSKLEKCKGVIYIMGELEAIQSFGNQGTADIFFGDNTKKARNTIPRELHPKAREIMDALNRGSSPMNLTIYDPEPLTNFEHWYSLRINRQYRVICCWDGENSKAYEVEATDYH